MQNGSCEGLGTRLEVFKEQGSKYELNPVPPLNADSFFSHPTFRLRILELLSQCLRVQWEAVNHLVPAIQLPQIVWIVGSW
jgi:hypothetical protein